MIVAGAVGVSFSLFLYTPKHTSYLLFHPLLTIVPLTTLLMSLNMSRLTGTFITRVTTYEWRQKLSARDGEKSEFWLIDLETSVMHLRFMLLVTTSRQNLAGETCPYSLLCLARRTEGASRYLCKQNTGSV